MNHFRISIADEITLLITQKQSHGRALAKDWPLTTVQRELKLLTEQKIIQSKQQGKNVIYKLRTGPQARAAVIAAETYALRKCLSKFPLLEPLIEDLQAMTNVPICVFGSYATGTATEKSDIDLHIFTDDSSIRKKIASINSKLSVKTGLISDEPLSREIKRKHIIIQGYDHYYGAFAKIPSNTD